MSKPKTVKAKVEPLIKAPPIRKQYYPADPSGFATPENLEGKTIRYLHLKNKAFNNWVVGIFDMTLDPYLKFGFYVHSVPQTTTDKEVKTKQARLQQFIANCLYDIMAVTIAYQIQQELENKK